MQRPGAALLPQPCGRYRCWQSCPGLRSRKLLPALATTVKQSCLDSWQGTCFGWHLALQIFVFTPFRDGRSRRSPAALAGWRQVKQRCGRCTLPLADWCTGSRQAAASWSSCCPVCNSTCRCWLMNRPGCCSCWKSLLPRSVRQHRGWRGRRHATGTARQCCPSPAVRCVHVVACEISCFFVYQPRQSPN